jgi:hypothetical protein
MPLFHIAHVSPTNHFFISGLCWMSGEAEEDYGFAIQAYKDIVRYPGIKQPDVALTDYCPASKKALFELFPELSQLLCMFHINAAVKKRIDETWKLRGIKKGTVEYEDTMKQRDKVFLEWIKVRYNLYIFLFSDLTL